MNIQTRQTPHRAHSPIRLLLSAWLLLSLALLAGCSESPSDLGSIRLAAPNQPSSALTIIALEKGYFAKQGLSVEVSHYPSGKRALLEGLLPGKADYAEAADIPFAWKSLEQPDLVTLAALHQTDNLNRIVARRDAGIESPGDLKGKHLATQKQSAVHYFLHLFLQDKGLHDNPLKISFMKAEQLPKALAAREIDAFSMREPYVSQAVELIGADKLLIMDAPGLYLQNSLLISRRGEVEQRPEVADALLRGLIEAEAYALSHPAEAIALVARQLGTTEERIAAAWEGFTLSVNLEHTMLNRLEQVVQWLIDDGLIEPRELPDFRTHLADEPLGRVRPATRLLLR